jgi:hypothetical protein
MSQNKRARLETYGTCFRPYKTQVIEASEVTHVPEQPEELLEFRKRLVDTLNDHKNQLSFTMRLLEIVDQRHHLLSQDSPSGTPYMVQEDLRRLEVIQDRRTWLVVTQTQAWRSFPDDHNGDT